VDNKKGICIIACGNPYYGAWSLNLAMGLRYTQPDCNITLLWQGNAKQYIEQYIFTFNKVIEIPKECTLSNGFESLLRAKVCLYDLSPYDETIFFDADTIWFPFKPVSKLFEELSNAEFSIGCRSKNDLANTDPRLVWCSKEELVKHYGECNIFNLSSEFIYFKKTETIKLFFDEVKKCFDNPLVEYRRFSGTVPDELAFQIAMIKTGVEPHKVPFLPFYWEPFERKNKVLSDLYKTDYYGYSIGGSTLQPLQKDTYDTLAKVYGQNFGVKYPFLSKSKRDLFTNRNTV